MLKRPFYFVDYIQINNEIWFTSGDYNGLYKYNLEEKRTERIAIFPYEPFEQVGLFLKMVQYKNSLIFVPATAKRIYIFNIEGGGFTDVKIPGLSDILQPIYFGEAVIYKEYLYLLGVRYPGIVKINLESYEVEIVDQWLDELSDEIMLDKNENILGYGGVVEEDRFLIPCYQCNRVLEFNMNTGEYCFHEIGNKVNKYVRMIRIKDTYVLVTHDNEEICHVIFWNYVKGGCEETQIQMQAFVDRGVIAYLGDIWVISYISNEVCRLETDERKASYYSVADVEKINIVFAGVIDNKLYFCDYSTQAWYVINNFGVIEKAGRGIKECIDEHEIEKLLLTEKWSNQYYVEDFFHPLEFLIKKIKKSDYIHDDFQKNVIAGNVIYESFSRK